MCHHAYGGHKRIPKQRTKKGETELDSLEKENEVMKNNSGTE